MKSLFVSAALGVAFVLAAGSAQAEQYSHKDRYHSHRAHWSGAYGSGSNIINSNCPAGTQPHVWPSASGYRCL
jgi:hypothetical protein